MKKIKENNNSTKLIIRIFKKFKINKQILKLKFLDQKQKLRFFFIFLRKNYPILAKFFKKKIKFFRKRFKVKLNNKFRSLKSRYKKENKFLTKRFKKILKNFSKNNKFFNLKYIMQKKLIKMSNFVVKKKLRKNLSKRTYFFRITRKTRRHRIKVVRINRKKPIFTKKTRKENKFLLRARESLLKTKKFLYRKQFPKIKGKKNKNFNFFYYNNMDRLPFRFHIGRIVITYLINNTFINIHNSKKMLKVLSAGKLGFKGPKRSTPYSRQVVARKAIKFISKTKLNILDIFLNSNYNRWYYFIFKEISKPRIRPYVIRYLVVSNPRSHGFIRDKKHRRK